MEEEQIEVNYRLDGDGRTIATNDSATNNNKEEKQETRDKKKIRYEPHSVMSKFVLQQKDDLKGGSDKNNTLLDQSCSWLDELLYDCEIADCGLMPRTFWVPAQSFEPRCWLEQMALDVFHHHTGATDYDPSNSGSEWWVQLRPSPEKTGRYAMHYNKDSDNTNNNGDDQDMAQEGISFHWDKDEDLRLLCGGNTYVHPHLSTVTYLTDFGAPTLAFNIRIHSLTGEWIMPNCRSDKMDSGFEQSKVKGFLSWPKFGKHLSFDGRYLHAAPADLMEKGAFQKQCQIPEHQPQNKATEETGDATTTDKTKLQRRHRRVTFLVNVWLNYKPFGVKPFPDTMINKLSGNKEKQHKLTMKFDNDNNPNSAIQNVVVDRGKGVNITYQAECSLEKFFWPLGDCDSGESMEADIPLALARAASEKGGSLQLLWERSKSEDAAEVESSGVRLCRNTHAVESSKARTATHTADETSDGAGAIKRPRLEEK
jgi:hypothetical protein